MFELKPRLGERNNDQLKDRETTITDHDGSPLGTYSTTFTHIYDRESYHGMNIDHYYRRKARGELLPLTYWRQEVMWGQSEFAWNLKYTATQYEQDTPWAPLSSAIMIPHNALDLKLYDTQYFVQAAAAKIYSSGWDTLTFVVELRKTLGLFRNLLPRLAELVKTGRADKLWLEGRYGWRLLWYDMQDINQAIANLDKTRTRFKESVGTDLTETEVTLNNENFGGAGYAVVRTTDTYKIGLRGTVVADIAPPSFAFNPVTTTWEVIPFSFVIDWFIGVGSFLEALSFSVLSHQYYAASGHYVEITRECTIDSVVPSAGFDLTVTGTASFRRVLTLRQPSGIPYHPLLQIRLDDFKIMDLLAIIVGNYRR